MAKKKKKRKRSSKPAAATKASADSPVEDEVEEVSTAPADTGEPESPAPKKKNKKAATKAASDSSGKQSARVDPKDKARKDSRPAVVELLDIPDDQADDPAVQQLETARQLFEIGNYNEARAILEKVGEDESAKQTLRSRADGFRDALSLETGSLIAIGVLAAIFIFILTRVY